MKYVTLTHDQKGKIIDEASRRQHCREVHTCDALADWARQSFGLHAAPNKATISRLLRNPLPLNHSGRSIDKTIRVRKGKLHNLEKALYQWVCDQFNSRVNLNGPMIRRKARRLLECTIQRGPRSDIGQPISCLKFSEGWLDNFKRRWKVRTIRSHGEDGDADLHAINDQLPSLRETLQSYDVKDIFNADECGLNYRMAPDTTVAHKALPGRKKAKERISILFCCNSDGSQKFEPMFIGNAAKPRAFMKKSGREHGFDYHHNKKSWMTSVLFFQWLHRFDDSIGQKSGRKAILLIDNCSAHGSPQTLPQLLNVTVKFLPPNTTSRLQPLDAGCIAAFKLRYRSFQLERALDLSEEGVTAIYKLDILTAMRAVKKIWSDISSTSIKNCWRHTNIVPQFDRLDRTDILSEDRERVMLAMEQIIAAPARMSIEHLMNADGEEEHCQVVTENDLVDQVIDDSDEEDESGNDIANLPNHVEQLRAIATVKRMMDVRNMGSDSNLRVLRDLQKTVRLESRRGLTQSNLDSFFISQ